MLRPLRTTRVVGWAFAVCGVVFGFSATAADGDLGGAVMMVLTGVLWVAMGLSVASARVTVTRGRLAYRYGLRSKVIPAADITAVDVGPGSGAVYPRLAVRVERRTGRAVRLLALQTPATARSRRLLADQVTAIRAALGTPAPV